MWDCIYFVVCFSLNHCPYYTIFIVPTQIFRRSPGRPPYIFLFPMEFVFFVDTTKRAIPNSRIFPFFWTNHSALFTWYSCNLIISRRGQNTGYFTYSQAKNISPRQSPQRNGFAQDLFSILIQPILWRKDPVIVFTILTLMLNDKSVIL